MGVGVGVGSSPVPDVAEADGEATVLGVGVGSGFFSGAHDAQRVTRVAKINRRVSKRFISGSFLISIMIFFLPPTAAFHN